MIGYVTEFYTPHKIGYLGEFHYFSGMEKARIDVGGQILTLKEVHPDFLIVEEKVTLEILEKPIYYARMDK